MGAGLIPCFDGSFARGKFSCIAAFYRSVEAWAVSGFDSFRICNTSLLLLLLFLLKVNCLLKMNVGVNSKQSCAFVPRLATKTDSSRGLANVSDANLKKVYWIF
jgi:hypothetical protein